MAAIQVGYGHGDSVGLPFDFYSGAAGVVSGSTIAMQTARLVLNPAGAVSVTITLPLNPSDGAECVIANISASAVTLTAVNANTGDAFVNGNLGAPTSIAAASASASAGSAAPALRYMYTLNGDISKGLSPRSWIRVQ